ncbi:putative (di)nucleoside polyphosphate hydrolase [Bradyrhizobium sp. USDA 377]
MILIVVPGRCDSIEPGTLRFRVRCFASPRNDDERYLQVTNEKPYRPNVGIALFNANGHVLIGHRFKGDGPEIILPGLDWQMPQGGVDEGENLRDAAMRELWEETSVVSADYLGETDWLTYEFPPYDGPQTHRLAKFRGQRQKWFALRFTGKDDEIDPLTPRNDQPAEFDAWRWERLDRVADLVVPFRRDVYRAVAREFAAFAN